MKGGRTKDAPKSINYEGKVDETLKVFYWVWWAMGISHNKKGLRKKPCSQKAKQSGRDEVRKRNP